MKPARVHNGSLHTFPGGGQGRNTLSRRFVQGWGLKTRRRAAILPWEREYARIKIDGLVGGNPDFTNAPAHADDDARFHDRQQASYTLAGDSSPVTPLGAPPRNPHRDIE